MSMEWGWTILYLTALFAWLLGRPYWRILFPRHPDWLYHVSQELHPFIPAAILANLVISTWDAPLFGRAFAFLGSTMTLIAWLRDEGDDDRWKKRRKKMGEKVRSIGHRLVVAPAR